MSDRQVLNTQYAILNTQYAILHTQQAFIFDLDGVLVDTATFHYRAWRQLANSLGFDFTVAQNEKLKGVSRMQSLDYILEWGKVEKSAEEKQALAEQKNNRYLEMVGTMNEDDVLPGTLDFLQAAKEQGKKIALGSASKNAPLILERTGIARYFDAVIDGNSVTKSKPDPEVFLKAAAALGVSPGESVVFEDAQAGIDAAIAAGMVAVGIGEASDLQGAVVVVPGLKALLA